MDVQKYLAYANSEEAYAILFVKKYLKQADSSVWIDILDYDAPLSYETKRLMFKSVTCELFPKKTTPRYPTHKQFHNKDDYIIACRAVTWKTANRDIAMLRQKHYAGRRYRIRGMLYQDIEPGPETLFIPSAPPEIKVLAENLNDRTDPLWDIAVQYIQPNRHKFKITGIKRL